MFFSGAFISSTKSIPGNFKKIKIFERFGTRFFSLQKHERNGMEKSWRELTLHSHPKLKFKIKICVDGWNGIVWICLDGWNESLDGIQSSFMHNGWSKCIGIRN